MKKLKRETEETCKYNEHIKELEDSMIWKVKEIINFSTLPPRREILAKLNEVLWDMMSEALGECMIHFYNKTFVKKDTQEISGMIRCLEKKYPTRYEGEFVPF